MKNDFVAQVFIGFALTVALVVALWLAAAAAAPASVISPADWLFHKPPGNKCWACGRSDYVLVGTVFNNCSHCGMPVF